MDLLGVVDRTTATTLLTGNRAETSEHRFLDRTLNGKLLRTMLGWETPRAIAPAWCRAGTWTLAWHGSRA